MHGRQQKVLELISNLELPNGATCLELGTGGGQNAIKYAEMGLHVHGVDSSEELLKTANKLALPGSNLKFSNVDLNSTMPFSDASFDLVVVAGTLQYASRTFSLCERCMPCLETWWILYRMSKEWYFFLMMRRPLSFLSCFLSEEGFEWGGRGVTPAIGTFVEGSKLF